MTKKHNRILCWDDKMIEQSHGIDIVMHKPEKKNIALLCDNEWEGVHNGYGSIVVVNGVYRLYYRASSSRHLMNKTMTPGRGVICVAESLDGITFRKPCIGQYDYNGTKYNNIVFQKEGDIDNFSVFYDSNPDCPKGERFKALSQVKTSTTDHRLFYYASEDGYVFREMGELSLRGEFDSFNVAFWDEETQQYFAYYRGYHTADGRDLTDTGLTDYVNDIRDIRVSTSKDFKTWEHHGIIQLEKGQKEYPLYTNQISKYFRADNAFIGFPVRYVDRAADKRNFAFMPLGDRHEIMTQLYTREGTALTDCVIMTSSDGITFNRRDDAYITPGPESGSNWWYGNCYTVYGLVQTQAEDFCGSDEISFYMGENYRIKSVNFRRYTVRLDGFFSWYAHDTGGEILTKPFVLAGDEMHINFATSARGGVTVTLCDEGGNALDGYKSYEMFGDSTDRPVEFTKSLSTLRGKTVRAKFTMHDAHLYSFVFQ